MEVKYTDIRTINLGNYESAKIGGEITLTDDDFEEKGLEPEDLFKRGEEAWHEIFDPRIEGLRRVAAKDSHVHRLPSLN